MFPLSAPLRALDTARIYSVQQSSNQYSFDLDFGSFEIRKAQAVLSDQWQSVRLPVSIGKSRRTNPEIDFIGDTLEKSVLSLLENDKRATINARRFLPSIYLASLEPVAARKGARLAYGEIWLDKELAIRVTLMESNWSADPSHWWIAYPAQYNPQTNHWDELFVIKDKKFKKKILDLVRDAYLDRYENEK